MAQLIEPVVIIILRNDQINSSDVTLNEQILKTNLHLITKEYKEGMSTHFITNALYICTHVVIIRLNACRN